MCKRNAEMGLDIPLLCPFCCWLSRTVGVLFHLHCFAVLSAMPAASLFSSPFAHVQVLLLPLSRIVRFVALLGATLKGEVRLDIRPSQQPPQRSGGPPRPRRHQQRGCRGGRLRARSRWTLVGTAARAPSLLSCVKELLTSTLTRPFANCRNRSRGIYGSCSTERQQKQ